MMRSLFVCFLFCLSFVACGAAPSVAQADSLALASRFDEAVEAYEAILADGNESPEIYYNLGYAYFKQGKLGKSILNFERSKRLDPANPDVLANLEMAYGLTDKMQVVEDVFFVQWWKGFKNIWGSNGWAVAFVLLFFLAICGVATFLFADVVSWRKAGFFASIALFVCAFVALSFSLQMRAEIINSSEAIIMPSSVDLRTSPDKNGAQMAVIHEGVHVVIIEQMGEWIEVRLKDGNIGWVRLAEVEKI